MLLQHLRAIGGCTDSTDFRYTEEPPMKDPPNKGHYVKTS